MDARTRSAHELELVAKAGRYLAGGTLGNLMEEVILERGRGSRVWDVSGHEYIDYLLGSGPMLVGHAHPEVVAAVHEQLERGSTFFANNEHAILLAEEISKAMPCAEKVRFCSSGTEATLYAMRIARAFRRRDRILKFEGGYHGMHDYAVMSMSPATPAQFPAPVAGLGGHPGGGRVHDAGGAVQRPRDDARPSSSGTGTSWPASSSSPSSACSPRAPGSWPGSAS